jgi:hypothetical protein
MTHYAELGRSRAEPAALPPRRNAPVRQGCPSPAGRFSIPAAAASAAAHQPGTDPDLSLGSTFDVPAFLRRQEG